MRTTGLVFAIAVFTGCSGDDGEQQTTATDPFDRFITTEQGIEASGSFDCFTPASDPSAIDWLSQSVDAASVATYPGSGIVEDFDEGTAVKEATLALFTDDSVAGGPDATISADDDGGVAFEADACAPLTYRVTTEGGPIPTKTTYKAHQIYGAPSGGAIENASFLSVSDVTYQLIPSILGVQVQPDLAIIAGTAYDCTRDPDQPSDDDAGKIEGVQVVVYDADGNIPDTLQVNYFVEKFPARDETHTSADGLWVASNVPPGDLTVEMWGVVGGELVLLGRSQLTSEADSINIANIFAGYGDGVKYPAACLAP